MSQLPRQDYELPRGGREVTRLNDQHHIWVTNIGYSVHPSVTSMLPNNCKVAEIATGTGIFLADLAKVLPSSSRLDGFDISDEQFPSTKPPNVSFHVHSATQPFPTEYHGQYDLVHIRLILAGLQDDDWEHCTRNCAQLLKPGGFLQWEEPELHDTASLPGDPAQDVTNLRTVVNAFTQHNAQRSRYVYELPRLFQEAGLQGVRRDVIASDRLPETREAHARVTLMVAIQWAMKMAETGADGAMSLEECRSLEEKVEKEVDAGAYTRYDINVIYGRKSGA